LNWFSGKAALRYPVPPAPRTAVLVPFLRPAGRVRVFPDGWGAESRAFQPSALAADWRQLRALLGQEIPSLTHAIIVLAPGPDELLSECQRRDLWRAFRVPVFEQIVAENGTLLAAECEAHEGLHVESSKLEAGLQPAAGFQPAPHGLALEPCGCGRSTPRLKLLHRDREQHVLRHFDNVPLRPR